ncbi:MAG: transporter substrate-binding domain-containing protein [Candidatus Sedimenticola sp. PURPLELP]
MKKRITRLILVILVLMAGHVTAGEQQELRVVGNHAPPYRIIEDNAFTGIYFDTMKELASRLDVEVRFIEVPFKRALYMMRYGNADIMLGPNRNTEREAYMEYTGATLPRESKAFYVHPEADGISRYEDLVGRLILVHQGKVYFDRFDQDETLRKVPVAEYGNAVQKVSNCVSCVVIMPEMEGDYLLKQLDVGLKKSGFKVEGKLSYITISRRSSTLSLQERMELAMEQMKMDGTFEKILTRYQRGGDSKGHLPQ